MDIITKCKHLKYFKFYYRGNTQLLSAAPNEHLQYLYIDLFLGVIDEVFMDSVSAHGKLEIVLLTASVTEAGITALIENSPKLCLFKIYFYQALFSSEQKRLKILKDKLKKKLIHRKLFNLDGFTIIVDINDDRIPVTI